MSRQRLEVLQVRKFTEVMNMGRKRRRRRTDRSLSNATGQICIRVGVAANRI